MRGRLWRETKLSSHASGWRMERSPNQHPTTFGYGRRAGWIWSVVHIRGQMTTLLEWPFRSRSPMYDYYADGPYTDSSRVALRYSPIDAWF